MNAFIDNLAKPAGIYTFSNVLNTVIPFLVKAIPMTHFISVGKRIVSFPIIEYWMGIRQISDYEKSNAELEIGGQS
jgi:hypothetical protein